MMARSDAVEFYGISSHSNLNRATLADSESEIGNVEKCALTISHFEGFGLRFGLTSDPGVGDLQLTQSLYESLPQILVRRFSTHAVSSRTGFKFQANLK